MAIQATEYLADRERGTQSSGMAKFLDHILNPHTTFCSIYISHHSSFIWRAVKLLTLVIKLLFIFYFLSRVSSDSSPSTSTPLLLVLLVLKAVI